MNKNSLKILVTGTRGIPNIQGGIETHCEKLYTRLSSQGFDITLVRRKCYVKERNRLNEYKGIKLKDIYAPHIKSAEAIIHTFLSICYAKKIDADIVHIHAIGPAILTPFAKLLGLKVVFTHHGEDYERQKWGSLAKKILRIGEKWAVKYADKIIVVSNSIKENIRRKYEKSDNVYVVYNGVEQPQLIQDEVNYIESLGLESRKYIFSLGRFVEEKNFHGLIEAYKKSEISKMYKLVIAGNADHETDYSVRLKKEAQHSGIVLTGFISGHKLAELFSHAGLFVLPSFHEGLPIALLEAMSYGLPSLVSDICSNRELIGEESDRYFDPYDIKELVSKLNDEQNIPYRKVIYDLSKFNWDNIADQTANIYTII